MNTNKKLFIVYTLGEQAVPNRPILDHDLRPKPGGAVLVDAKHSVNTNLTTGSLKSRLTESQQAVFGWFADPKVGPKNLSFVPVGKNAQNANLTLGKSIKVSGIEVHVESPVTGGITARTYP